MANAIPASTLRSRNANNIASMHQSSETMSLIGCIDINRNAGTVASISDAPNADSSDSPNVRASANIATRHKSAATGVT